MEKNTEIKKEIRKQYLKLRSEISAEEKKTAENAITERLLSTEQFKNARFIYCYVSVRDEVSTQQIIGEALKTGKKVAVPCVKGRQKMEFYFIQNRSDLQPGHFQIPEPGPWCQKAPFPDEETLVIMPGTAFDRSGMRLGYGAGYYDTYLAGHLSCIRIALAFSVQCTDHIPGEETDVHANMIITEKEVIQCRQDCQKIR